MGAILGAPATSLSSPFGCPSSVVVLDAVYHASADRVDRASATSLATAPAVGIVVHKMSPTTCILAYKGEISTFSGLVPSSTYYLDVAAGQITPSPLSTTGNILQRIGWARNPTTLVVEIDLDFQQL